MQGERKVRKKSACFENLLEPEQKTIKERIREWLYHFTLQDLLLLIKCLDTKNSEEINGNHLLSLFQIGTAIDNRRDFWSSKFNKT